MITIEFNPVYAEQLIGTLDTVLENGDLHYDEAHELEALRNTLEFKLEKHKDHSTDVEAVY